MGKLSKRICVLGMFILVGMILIAGCIEQETRPDDTLSLFQEVRINKGLQVRVADDGLESLLPADDPQKPKLEIVEDPDSKSKVVKLSIDDALVRALANSQEIQIVSYDPEIAKEDVIKAYGQFEPAAFGSYNYENEDNPTDSIFLGGQSNSRVLETGIKQRNQIGLEWSASYALSRNWDDLTRTLDTRFEPMLAFQIRQPLLRDGWAEVNMAGINITKLNLKIAMAAFREKTEEVSAQVMTLYWMLLSARENVEIHRWLMDKTTATLEKVNARKGIDATELHIKQAESSLKSRESMLYDAEKKLKDVQEALLQLLADSQLNILDDFTIIPVSEPEVTAEKIEVNQALGVALANNPIIQQAKMGVEIADINITVAENQKMPRLDLIASARITGLDNHYSSSHEQLRDGDYTSYGVGISFEIPLGNSQRKAELRKRRLERLKAKTILRNIADQVAVQTKERIRMLAKSQKEMGVQDQAVAAAAIHLQAVEDTELIRPSLTPEFLLVKLEAQESLAIARQKKTRAVVDFNNALVQLSQAMGTVLQLHQVKDSLPIN